MYLDVVVAGVSEVVVWVTNPLEIIVVLSFREPVPDQVGEVAPEGNTHILSRVEGLRKEAMTVDIGYVVALFSVIFSDSC